MGYYGNRKYRGRRNYRLSDRRIYGRTSAKSQAAQIAALRNRVNRVYNVCKPETKTIVTSATELSYTSSSLSSYWHGYAMTYPDLGTGDKDRIGNMIRVLNGVLYLSCEYFNNSTTGYHDSESSGAQVRVIIGQFNATHAHGTTPNIDNVFEFPSNTGANYTQLALSPLREGITNSNRILKDIRFTMTSDRNQKMLKIPYNPPNPFVFDDNGTFPAVWAMIVVTGLHYDSDFTETVKITTSDKLVFTDA